jgi:hypothetical protein
MENVDDFFLHPMLLVPPVQLGQGAPLSVESDRE